MPSIKVDPRQNDGQMVHSFLTIKSLFVYFTKVATCSQNHQDEFHVAFSKISHRFKIYEIEIGNIAYKNFPFNETHDKWSWSFITRSSFLLVKISFEEENP